MDLGLTENACLGPVLPQVRAALLRLRFQRDYPVAFSLFKDSAALDCSRRVLLPFGNCGDNFLIQNFPFPLCGFQAAGKGGSGLQVQLQTTALSKLVKSPPAEQTLDAAILQTWV